MILHAIASPPGFEEQLHVVRPRQENREKEVEISVHYRLVSHLRQRVGNAAVLERPAAAASC